MNNNLQYGSNNFESIKIGLASPEKILEWSHGEVTKPETINYRTLKPEIDGLFCEKIFGPTKDWECHCGKYKRVRFKGIVCDRCGVEVTRAKVRRERMGHIELAAPVSHIWYFKGVPSRMALTLELSPKGLEKVLYFAAYIVTDPGDPKVTGLKYKQLLTEQEYKDAKDNFGDQFKAGMGAEAIKTLLAEIDLDKLSEELRAEYLEIAKQKRRKNKSGQSKMKVIRRLDVIESLRRSGNRPEWMVLTHIPVIPPDLRPMVQLDGGRFATSDLNDLYRRVINRNNRLKKLMELAAPEIIIRNEKRMLQEAVDALIDNGRRGRAVTGPGNRPLKSLSDMLKGKQGRFRQNLLGKRVDYSGRSVIVVGPELKFYQCGLPKKMALELFKPFIMKVLNETVTMGNIRAAKKMVEKESPEVWDILEDVIREHPVMLNRAPTLHRLGIQAFEPVLVEGKAIQLHPLVCTAFNADFDGDQMAVHVPLSVEAQSEARFLMLSINNILAPKDGSPITTPTQDMILGSYYLTHDTEKEKSVQSKKRERIFADEDEMMMAYMKKDIDLHTRVAVRKFAGPDDLCGKLVHSTVGRFIFNTEIPQDLGYVNRERDPYSLEVDFLCDKKKLGDIIQRCYQKHGNAGTVNMLDHIKEIGFHYSTIAAITISVSDMEIPEEKFSIIDEAEATVLKYEGLYRRGLMSDAERYERVIETWNKATDDVGDALYNSLDTLNNLYIMANSGARGSKKQIRQIGGMRGLMANATGKTVEIPIKANFREGLSVLEYFISSNGARKGLADTALRTADSGYLTRRLVDVAHNVIVREYDCGTDEGIEVKAFADGKEPIESLNARIVGRTSLKDIAHPKTGELIVGQDEEITEEKAAKIIKAGIESVAIRSVMTCHSSNGICAKCYGRNLATGEEVNIGEAVGITAAQSIGEPGTQLTMRTFHTGGVAGSDITSGLPRVEELFEAREPKGLAQICEVEGEVISIEPTSESTTAITIKTEPVKEYEIPAGEIIDREEGDEIAVGDVIAKQTLDSQTNIRYNGVEKGIIKSIAKQRGGGFKISIEDKTEKVYNIPYGAIILVSIGDQLKPGDQITKGPLNPNDILKYQGVQGVYQYLLKEVQRVYKNQGVDINDKHIEVIVSRMLSKYRVVDPGETYLIPNSLYSKQEILEENERAKAEGLMPAGIERVLQGITKSSLSTMSFLSSASFQETTRVLTEAAIKGRRDRLFGLKENVIIGQLIPAGTGIKRYKNVDIDYGPNKDSQAAVVKEIRNEDPAFMADDKIFGYTKEDMEKQAEEAAKAAEEAAAAAAAAEEAARAAEAAGEETAEA